MLVHLILLEIKTFFRERAAVFWTFVYPFVMLIALNAFFSPSQNTTTEVYLAVNDKANNQWSEQYLTTLKQRLKNYGFTLDISIENNKHPELTIPEHFPNINKMTSVITLRSGKNATENGLVFGVLNEVNERFNRDLQNIDNRFDIAFIPANQDQLDYSLFLITGLIALVIFSTSMFGFAGPLISLREVGALKRFQFLPLRKSTYLLSYIASRAIILSLFSMVFIIAAHYFYEYQALLTGTRLFKAFIVLTVGIFAFLAIGFYLSTLFSKMATASTFFSVAYIPIMLLSNAIIPTRFFSEQVASVLSYIPTNLFIESLRQVIYEDGNLHSQWLTLSVLILCFLLFSIFALKRFTWVNQSS